MVGSSFRDRHEAGEALAECLGLYKENPNAIVLGLPRGGVVVAAAISEALKLPLDVLIARNLRAPCDKECTLGAVTETGVIYIDPSVLCVQNCLRSDLRAYLEHEIDVQKAEILRQTHLYRDDMSVADVNGKTVILADDGVATGATFFAAADALRKLGAEKIVGALPVGPDEVIRNLRYKVDELTVLLRPERFVAISDYYGSFTQTSDEEVTRLLLPSGIPARRRHVA